MYQLNSKIKFIQGRATKSSHQGKYCQNFITEVSEMCNTVMEQKFSWLSEDSFENCEKSSYKTLFTFFW